MYTLTVAFSPCPQLILLRVSFFSQDLDLCRNTTIIGNATKIAHLGGFTGSGIFNWVRQLRIGAFGNVTLAVAFSSCTQLIRFRVSFFSQDDNTMQFTCPPHQFSPLATLSYGSRYDFVLFSGRTCDVAPCCAVGVIACWSNCMLECCTGVLEHCLGDQR